jgi:phospho-N-acetylmuramoyl-pentapeptide-transferase
VIVLYELFHDVLSTLPGANLLRYISFRAVAAALTAFVVSLVAGGYAIRWLARVGVREKTEKTGSATLAAMHEKKRGTPTMGGLFLIGSLLLSSLLWLRFDGSNVFSGAALLLVAWFAAIGLLDDWIKLRIPGRAGLRGRTKQLLLTVGAVAAGIHLLAVGLESGRPSLYVPFFSGTVLDLGGWAGVPFVLVGILVLTGAANAVNLTDGLDGLAVGCVICAGLAYAGICYFVGHAGLADYLLVAHVPGAGEMTVLLGALLGAGLGFLWYNAAPAEVFMGDVGSLPLGGALGYAALVSRTELVLLVVGGVFVAEALSVVAQVASFKMRGKRIFRCAPLHHHFQFAGMPETRLVVRIWLCSALLALSSLALFKVR